MQAKHREINNIGWEKVRVPDFDFPFVDAFRVSTTKFVTELFKEYFLEGIQL